MRTIDTVSLPLRTRRTRFSPVDNIDLLRLVAVVLVTGQHALSLLGRDDLTTVIGVNIGQVGVDLFLGISALLAVAVCPAAGPMAGPAPHTNLPRLLACDGPQFQLTGASVTRLSGRAVFVPVGWTGLFTHPMNLVDLPTWFISLLLTCYVRCSRHDCRGFLDCYTSHAPPSCPRGWFRNLALVACGAFAYACGCVRGWWASDRPRPAIVAATAAAVAVAVRAVPELVCPTVSLFLIASALALRPVSIPTVRQLNACTYEYYLVHGIFLNLAVLLLSGHPILAVASGVLLASAGAIVYQRSAAVLTASVSSLFDRRV